MGKAQVGLEYLVLVSFFLLVVTPLFYLASDRSQKTTNLREAQITVDKLENAINTVYADGHPAQREILVFIPELVNASHSYMNASTINYGINFDDRVTDVFADTATCLQGTLPVQPGYYRVIVKALENGCVDIGVANVAVIPESLDALVDYSREYSQDFRITNLQEFTIQDLSVNTTGALEGRVDLSVEPGRQDDHYYESLGVGETKVLTTTFFGDNYPATYEGNFSLSGFGMANTTIPVRVTVAVGDLVISGAESAFVAIDTNKTTSLTVRNQGAGSLFDVNLTASNELSGLVDLNTNTSSVDSFVTIGSLSSGESKELSVKLVGVDYGAYSGTIVGDSTPDVAGTNEHNHSLEISVGDDTTPPVINSTSADKDYAIIGESVCVNATVTDDTEVNEAWLRVTNPDSQTYNFSMHDSGVNCAGVEGDAWYGSEFVLNVNGTWVINSSNAEDTSGNWASHQAVISVPVEGNDYIPPIISIDYPDNKSYSSNSFFVNASTNERCSSCSYNVDFSSPTNVSMNEENLTHFYSSITGLSDATHSVTVYCSDVHNNTNHTGLTRYFTVDTVDPVVENCTLNDQYLRSGESALLSCQVRDENPSSAWFVVGGEDIMGTSSGNNTYAGAYYCSETSIKEWSEAHANDTAGNEGSTSVGVNVTCDTTPPVINSTSTNQSSAEVGSYVCLSAQASDNYNLSFAWSELVTPLNTTHNVILEDTGASCAGVEGDGVYGGNLYLLAIGNWTLVTSHANDDAGNTGDDSAHENETIVVSAAEGGEGGYTYVDASRSYWFRTNGEGRNTRDSDMKSWENITTDFTDDDPTTPPSAYQLSMDIKLFAYDKYDGYVVKLNADPSIYSTVALKFKVDSLEYEPYPIRVYAYNPDGDSIITSEGFTEYTYSSTGWHEVDVTDTAHLMDGNGWMKFRVLPKFAWWIDNKKSRWVEVDFGIG